MQILRENYQQLFIEIADSNLLESILNEVYGVKGNYKKMSDNLSDAIRGCEYPLS